MPTTTKSNAARRKAPQNAQERPAVQVVQFSPAVHKTPADGPAGGAGGGLRVRP